MSSVLRNCKSILICFVFALAFAAMPSFSATFVVTSTDGGTDAGTIRWAVEQADANPGADIIDLTGISGTIAFSGWAGGINAESEITFNGPGKDVLTIKGSDNNVTITLQSTANVTFNDLTLEVSNYRLTDVYSGAAIQSYNRCNLIKSLTSVNGMISVEYGVLNLTDCLVDGGGRASYPNITAYSNSTINALRTTFANMYSNVNSGGAIYAENACNLNLTNCTFYNCRSTGSGGAIYCNSSVFIATNCTFYGNQARYLGGAGEYGGVIYTDGFNTSLFKNCIFSHNGIGLGGTIPDDISAPSITSGGYNIFEDETALSFSFATSDLVGVQPNLNIASGLAQGSGQVPILALQRGSICINALPAGGNGAPATDASNHTRIGNPDIGAAEYIYTDPFFSAGLLISVGNNTFTHTAELISDGGYYDISAKGYVYSTSENPTYEGSSHSDGIAGIGTLPVPTDLQQATTYFVRPYAIGNGTPFYGNQFVVSTIPTLGEWGLIAFGGLIAVIGGIVVWRRIA